jgi:CRISPR-associated protein Cmr3
VLQTPAIFASGWLPGTVRETSEGPVLVADAFQARLVAASIGTPELAGGWDLVRGRPKPFRRTVPAGGVYWFEVVEGDRSAPWAAYHDRSVSDERAHEGYGLVHVGGWDYV